MPDARGLYERFYGGKYVAAVTNGGELKITWGLGAVEEG